jgi:tetratricopeptide (TPR) repeat protein
MKNSTYLFATICFLAASMLMASCSKESKRDAAFKELKALESETLNQKMVDPQLGKKLVERYQYFANTFPEDSLHASDFLIKGGEVANAMGDGKQAEQLFISALQKYPTHANAAKALFMLAFCYENTLANQAEAGKRYKEFLEKYPNDKLAASAKSALDNLGKTPEELVKEFEAKNATAK